MSEEPSLPVVEKRRRTSSGLPLPGSRSDGGEEDFLTFDGGEGSRERRGTEDEVSKRERKAVGSWLVGKKRCKRSFRLLGPREAPQKLGRAEAASDPTLEGSFVASFCGTEYSRG